MKNAFPLSLAATLLAAAAASAAGPGITHITFERQNHFLLNSAPIPLGPLASGSVGSIRFHSGKPGSGPRFLGSDTDGPVCVTTWNWTGTARSAATYGPQVLKSMDEDGTTCGGTRPLRIRVGAGANYVGFFIIGINPAGWRLTAKAGTNVLFTKHAVQNGNKLNHWVWFADANHSISDVYIEPLGTTTPSYAIDGVAIATGSSSLEDSLEE